LPYGFYSARTLQCWNSDSLSLLQVWRPKEASQQTAVHQGSTMPRKLRFVGGLRDAPERQLRVLTLDLDLGQQRSGSGC
jgi:hypothetical protein